MPDDLVPYVTNALGAVAALGTAAYGLVDASKAFRGGASNAGFRFIRDAVQPFIQGAPASTADSQAFGPQQILVTLRANWLNGVAKADQKAIAKSLIRLCVTPDSADSLAKATGLDPAALKNVATKIRDGNELSSQEINLLGRFDAIVSARLDAGYERADQQYRNTAKVLAAIVAIVLAVVAGGLIYGKPVADYLGSANFWVALLIGAISTPLAPIAKDLSTTLVAAVNAVRGTKR
jgi:hypothetical protein